MVSCSKSLTGPKCDVTGLFGELEDGDHDLRYKPKNSKVVRSEVTCIDSICTPRYPGPTNACKYICGKRWKKAKCQEVID